MVSVIQTRWQKPGYDILILYMNIFSTCYTIRWKFCPKYLATNWWSKRRQMLSNYTVISKDSKRENEKLSNEISSTNIESIIKFSKPHFQHFTVSVTRLTNLLQHVYHALTFCINVCLLHASTFTFNISAAKKEKKHFCVISKIQTKQFHLDLVTLGVRHLPHVSNNVLRHQEITFVGKVLYFASF